METSITIPKQQRPPAIWLVRFFGVWATLVGILMFVAVVTTSDPITRAELGMAIGLFLGWIVLGGAIMLAVRNSVQRFMKRFAQHWRWAFVLFATILALIEEAITTTMTNTAPLWGIPLGKAYITASANYLEVVLYHSVIVFIPMFIVWAWLLKRYAFHPNTVFVLFGLTGTLSESLTFGLQNLIVVGFWIYVYGLMVYLPTYATPSERGVRRPRFGAHLLALILPILASIPVALVILAINPPQHAFPPLMPR